MSFFFANPWGLLGLLSLPAIVAIHMYHHRYPPLLIAGAHLWGAEMKMTSAGRRRQRLPITSSLILELLAALVLSLVLANPTFGDLGKVTHLVVVLDNSASMQARSPGQPSFRDRAVAELARRVNREDRDTLLTLITTGRRVKKLAGPVTWEDAQVALKDWVPAEPHHDVQVAWDRAAQVAGDTGELLFLTDHQPGKDVPVPKDLEIVSYGKKLANVAFTAARWTFDPTTAKGTLFLRLHNYGSASADVRILGEVAGKNLFARSVTLSPHSAVPAEIPVPGGLGELKVTLQSPQDALDVDNTVVLIEPKTETLKVDLKLDPESPAYRAVEKVLSVVPNVETTFTGAPHLVIGPAAELPASDSALWWLGIGPVDPSEEARQAATDLIGPYLLEKQHPLLGGVVLGGVVWGGVQKLPYDVSPVISSGKSILLGRLAGTATTAFVMNIDFARSNLSESPDWPILLLNLLDQRRKALPGLAQWNYRLNEDIQFRLYEGTTDPAGDDPPPLVLRHTSDDRPLVRGDVVYISGLNETGVYEIREGERTLDRFSVNFFDPYESDLSSLTPGVRAAAGKPTELFAPDDPYSWLIMIGTFLILLFIFLDWYVLAPKARATG